jgi:hypothetical protein
MATVKENKFSWLLGYGKVQLIDSGKIASKHPYFIRDGPLFRCSKRDPLYLSGRLFAVF